VKINTSLNLLATAKNEHQQKVLDGVAIWASYYRSNIHRFAEDYLHVHLKLFQIFLLYMMNICTTFVFIGFRGIGKSFLCAVFCCARAILYPGSKIVIASGTRGQSINVLEKIMTEIRPNSPELANEIDEKETNINNTTAKITFKNSSTIKVVTASDTARSNRANLLIVDEFRMVKKVVIDTILRKFLAAPRHPRFLDRPEYRGKKEYQEHNMTMYLSSAYFQDHWSYIRAKDSCRFMLDPDKHNFVCGFPYQLGLKEDILLGEEVEEQMTETDFNEISWSMEMDSVFYGDANGSFFSFDMLSKNRKIEYPMLPDSLASKLPGCNKVRIQPKQPGEKRILSVDVALMASTKHKNDATAIFINQLIPTKAGRYTSNIVYGEVNEGFTTDAEALRVRKLKEEYDADLIVLDTRGLGIGVFDALIREINDPDSGEAYPALSCCNNAEMAARCKVRNAEKAIWAIMGSSKFNSDCALGLREGFRTGRIRLLISEFDAEELLGQIKGYSSLSLADRSSLTLPYINTTLLINELINLQHEEVSGLVRLYEKPGARKDRYSSLSYSFYVANQLEKNLRHGDSDAGLSKDAFIIRAPKNKLLERR
jgi:hypothetical protein